MEYAEFVDHVRADGVLLADTADGNIDAYVPSCPDWQVRDLVAHVAQVYEHKIASTELQRAPDPWPPDRPADRDPVEWFRDAHGRLLAMFQVHEPTDPSPTWWPDDQTVGFWARRMAHETAIHGADAELAFGPATALDAALAVDGIDEFLTYFVPDDESGAPALAGSVHLHCTDAYGEWTVTPGDDGVTVARDHAKADTALRGAANDLLLVLWRRLPLDAVTVFGDAALAAAFAHGGVTD